MFTHISAHFRLVKIIFSCISCVVAMYVISILNMVSNTVEV